MAAFRFCPVCAVPLEPLPAGHDDAGRLGCPAGHFVHYDNPAITAFAFVADDDGRWLVLRRARAPQLGRWDLPGGFVEAGETPAEAVVRELREETGLEVAVERLLGVYAGEYGETGRWTVDAGFTCRVTGGAFRLNDEKSAAAWLPLDQLPRLAFAGERAGLEDLRRG